MTRAQLLDIAERVGWTFAQAFLAVFVVTDLSSARTAATAGAAAAIAVIKGVVATRVGARTAGLPDSAPPPA